MYFFAYLAYNNQNTGFIDLKAWVCFDMSKVNYTGRIHIEFWKDAMSLYGCLLLTCLIEC